MESSSTPVKEKKGIKRLWNKIKLAVRFKSKDKNKDKNNTTISGPSNTQGLQTTATQQHQEIHPTVPAGAAEVTPISVPDNSIPIVEVPVETPVEPSAETTVISAMPPDNQPEHTQAEPVQQSKDEPENQPSTQNTMADEAKEELARRYERAQAIFKKYNIDLNEAGWDFPPKQQIERVHKQTRIRVRWTCHECKTTFGHERICVECAHQRCKTCVRYPPKRKKARDTKKTVSTATTSEPSTSRVHDGACHECQTTFKIGSEECSNCHHTICHRCLQESLASAEQGEERTTVII